MYYNNANMPYNKANMLCNTPYEKCGIPKKEYSHDFGENYPNMMMMGFIFNHLMVGITCGGIGVGFYYLIRLKKRR